MFTPSGGIYQYARFRSCSCLGSYKLLLIFPASEYWQSFARLLFLTCERIFPLHTPNPAVTHISITVSALFRLVFLLGSCCCSSRLNSGLGFAMCGPSVCTPFSFHFFFVFCSPGTSVGSAVQRDPRSATLCVVIRCSDIGCCCSCSSSIPSGQQPGYYNIKKTRKSRLG